MSVRFKGNETIIYNDREDQNSNGTCTNLDAIDDANGVVSNDGMEGEEDDEQSLSEEECSDNSEGSNDSEEEKEDGGSDEEKTTNRNEIGTLEKISSCRSNKTVSTRSVIEWEDECDNDAGFSQDPRSFMSRIFWNETDVRFYNQTDREVMFVIADEEFTLKRVSKVSASASLNDDDDDDDNDDFKISDALAGFIPISINVNRNQSQIATQSALKTRCMPLAPHSDSSQYFQEERLTYVTVLTKDIDGEDMPWSRVHYENKVINCKRTKSLKFFNKHLKVMAYRIARQPQSSLSETQIVSPMTSSIRDLKQITRSKSSRSSRGNTQKRLSITKKQDSKKRIKGGV